MSCPVVDHLACKIPGDKEPVMYDVWRSFSINAGVLFQRQAVEIANRDAPWHLCSLGARLVSGTGPFQVRIYNARDVGASDALVRVGARFGAVNAPVPVNPSMVWPVNSALIIDVQNAGPDPAVLEVFCFGFKVYDRGKSPC